MSSLRQVVDGETISILNVSRPKTAVSAAFSVKQQVVVSEQTSRSGPMTKEMKVGTVMAVGEDKVTVSFPAPGGRSVHKEVPIESVKPVSEVYRRNSVQINPMFRQIFKGSV